MDARYLKFIVDNRVNILDTNIDIHHIKPFHMGGEDLPENICYLSRENHIKAHELLYEIYGMILDSKSSKFLKNSIRRGDKRPDISAKLKKYFQANPPDADRRYKYGNAARGKKKSDETKKKMSIWQKGVSKGPMKDEHKKKISATMTGKKRTPCSEETKQKMRDKMKGVAKGPMSAATREKIRLSRLGKPSNRLKNK